MIPFTSTCGEKAQLIYKFNIYYEQGQIKSINPQVFIFTYRGPCVDYKVLTGDRHSRITSSGRSTRQNQWRGRWQRNLLPPTRDAGGPTKQRTAHSTQPYERRSKSLLRGKALNRTITKQHKASFTLESPLIKFVPSTRIHRVCLKEFRSYFSFQNS